MDLLKFNNKFSLIWYLIKTRIIWHIVLLIITILALIINFVSPFIIKNIIDSIIPSGNLVHLKNMLILLIFFAISSGVLNFVENILFVNLGQDTLIHLKSIVFNHVLHLDSKHHLNQNSGYMSARILGELYAINTLVTKTFNQTIVDILSFTITVCILSYINIKLSIISLFFFPVLYFFLSYFGNKITKYSVDLYEQHANLNGFTQNILSGILTIISFSAHKFILQQFQYLNNEIKKISLKINIYESALMQISSIIFTLVPYLIIWYGAILIIHKEFTIGTLFVFYSLLISAFGTLFRIVNTQINFKETKASFNRLWELINFSKEKNNGNNVFNNGNIYIENISFKYNEDSPLIINNLTQMFKTNQITLIIGKNGVGKSTIAKLLLRICTPLNGKIYINDIDIKNIELNELRKNITFISQDTLLFSTSILDNLCLGQDYKMQEIKAACKKVGIEEFIENLPQKYQTIILENGKTMSSGQIQKLMLARMLIKNSPIMIFDEPTSNLDKKALHFFKNILIDLKENHTILVITHDNNLLEIGDSIIELN